MKEYTSKQIRQLQSNTYTLKVTKCKLYFTAKFKEDFWIRYQAGDAPRKILTDLGYDISLFGQKQIDSLVQRIKQQALSGEGFREGENHDKRLPEKGSSDLSTSSTWGNDNIFSNYRFFVFAHFISDNIVIIFT